MLEMNRPANCKCFVNANCAFYCPNAAVEEFEETYDLPASEIGLERIKCKECMYIPKNCTCENDCYIHNTKDCPIFKDVLITNQLESR